MKFSIITAIYNCENYLSQSIESVINQDIGFKDNIQLILVDDGSTDKSKDIALKYMDKFPENIIVLSKQNGGPGSARNMGLDHACGEYVNFLDGDDMLSSDVLSSVYAFFDENDVDVVSIPLIFFERRDGDHVLNYKFEKTQVIDLNQLFDYPQLHVASSFIKSESIGSLRFDESLTSGEDALFLNKILLKNPKYGVLDNVSYHYRKRDDFSSLMDKANVTTDYFGEKIEKYYLGLIDDSLERYSEVARFIQYLISYDVNSIVEARDFKPDNEFLEKFNRILSYIDADVIANHRYLGSNVKSFLIYLKNKDFHVESGDSQVFLKSKDYTINRLHKHKLRFKSVKFKNNNLFLEGYFSSNCDVKDIKIIAFKNHKPLETVFTNLRTPKKLLNIDWEFYYTFEANIPIADKEEAEITFKVKAFGELMENKIVLKNDAEALNSKHVIENNKIILFKDNTFHIYNDSFKNKIRFNLSNISK